MKKFPLMIAVLLVLLLLAACGTEQTQETWDITYNSDGMALYARGYDTVEELMTDEYVIVRATPVTVVEERQYGVVLELEVAESSMEGMKSVRILQLKDERFVLKKGQEVVAVLKPDYEDGIYNIPNDDCGLFRIDPETGDMTGEFLESLIEDAPAAYSANGGADLSLEEVFDLLVDKSGAAG